MTKRLFDRAGESTLEEQLELEAQLQVAAIQTEDFREGVAAFLREAAAELQRPLRRVRISPSFGKRPTPCLEKTVSPSRTRRTATARP